MERFPISELGENIPTTFPSRTYGETRMSGCFLYSMTSRVCGNEADSRTNVVRSQFAARWLSHVVRVVFINPRLLSPCLRDVPGLSFVVGLVSG